MKSSKKVLAFALAAAMVVTAVPATNAQAASTAKLNATKATVYAGSTKTLTVKAPKSWKNVKVTKVSTSKKSVATVKKTATKKVKVTAVKAGTAKVTVKVTYKKSAKKNAKTYTKNLTSKITVKNPTIKVTSDSEIAIGTTTQVKATVKPSTAKVTYTTSDEKIATVDATSGIVTGVATGDVTITATAKNGKKTVKTEKKISVKKAILKSAVQKEYNKVDVVIIGDAKDIKANDLKITNNTTHATTVVKAVKAKKNAADTYTVETYTGMTDGKEYTVEFAGASTTFPATDGTVAKVGISTQTIAAGTATEVKATTLDKDGIVLSYESLSNTDSSKGKTTSEVKLTKGYLSETNLYLPAVGDTASVKVTYHTGTFGADGKEAGNYENTFTVTAIDPALLNLNYAITVSDSVPAWKANSFKANTNVKLGAERTAYLRITDENGNDISDYSEYKVESADKSKLLVAADTTLADNKTPIKVNGVAEGSTYVIVKKADKTVASLAVSVVAKPVATTLDMNKTSVTVMQGKNVDETVQLTLKDQYSDEMQPLDNLDVTLLGKPSKTVSFASYSIGASVKGKSGINVNKATKTVAVSGSAFSSTNDLGTYTFKVSATKDNKTIDRTLVVNVVKAATDVQAYDLKFNQTSVDTTVGGGAVSGKQITVDVARMANGGAIDTLAGSTNTVKYTVKNAKNEVIACVGTAAGASAKTCGAISGITGNTLVIDPIVTTTGAFSTARPGNYYVKNLDAGTYNVTAEFTANGKPVTCVGSFEIKDTQDTKVSYEIPNYDFVDAAGRKLTVEEAFANKTLVKVYYDGLEQNVNISDVIEVKGTKIAGNTTGAYVATVKVFVNISGTSNYVAVSVPVNHVVDVCDPSTIK